MKKLFPREVDIKTGPPPLDLDLRWAYPSQSNLFDDPQLFFFTFFKGHFKKERGAYRWHFDFLVAKGARAIYP